MKKALVLIVEKDRALAAQAVGVLDKAGFAVAVAADGTDGLRKIYEMNPDVIIASTDLPPVNGEDACQRIRQASYLPLILLGTRDEVAEILELGADACIVRPPNDREMVARVHSLLKRSGFGDPPEAGNSAGGRYGENGENLSPTESRLRRCLASHEGRLIEYPRLITGVWGGKEVSLGTLHCYVRRLRRKLTDFQIMGVRGIGYGFYGSE